MLFCQSSSSLTLYYLVSTITLIGDQNLSDIGVSMLLNLLKPVRDVCESLLVSAVIHQDNAHCSFIVSLSYGSETLLPSCVPYLKLNLFAVNIYLLNLEVDT